jgi:CelD/BcsL family acetyltransferase involved in cellulose biosynthesis
VSIALQARSIGDDASLEALVGDWWDLWRRCPTATPFQSPAWLIAWWRAFRPGTLATLAAYHEDRLMGLAPFYCEEGELGRRLLPLGISISDYLDVLLDPACRDLAAASLASGALRLPMPWERWELEELAPEAAGREMPCPVGCRAEMSEQALCTVLILPETLDALASRVSRRKRRRLALARNRADRIGGFEVTTVGADAAPEFVDELIRLHRSRWQRRGEAGVLADERVGAFHKGVAPELHRRGLARFYLGTIGGRAVAALYTLRRGERLMLYLAGFDPEHSFESPGQLLVAHVVEAALAEGMREVHFLRGREAYKYEWNPVERVNLKRSFVRSP